MKITEKHKLSAQLFLKNREELSKHRREAIENRRLMWENLKKIRKVFTIKEYAILKMRTIECRTLEQVGRDFGVTRERVRQIEFKIESKLKNINADS